MIGKRVTVGVAVTVAVICGVMLSTGMATAASDRTVIDSPTSEYGFVGSSVGESTQQLQSTTVATQQNTDFVFSSYDEVYGVFWIGQTFVLEGLEPNAEIQIRERIDDQNSALRDVFISDSAGTITVDTGSLDRGDYYIYGGGINEGPDSSSPPDLSNTFELVSQTLDAHIESYSVGNTVGSSTVLEMNSNRAEYPITVHAYGQLSTGELREIFVENEKSSFDPDQTSTRQGGNGITAYDEIRINGVTDSDEHVLDFTGIDSRDYALEFTSSDSIVDDPNPTITVTEGAGDQVELSSVDLTPTNTVTESPRMYQLTFEASHVSTDGKQDDFTVEMPQSVALVDIEDVTVTNGNYDTTYSESGNSIEFSVDPDRDYGGSVDLSFEVDMTLIKSS